MDSRKYWQLRAEERIALSMENEDAVSERLRGKLRSSIQSIEEDIIRLYAKYAKDNSMSYQDALRYLTDDERKEFQRDLQFYIERYHDKEYVSKNRAYLQALSTRARVRRMEMLKAHIRQQADGLGRFFHGDVRGMLKENYQLGQYHTMFSAAQYTALRDGTATGQIAVRMDQVSDDAVDQLLRQPWSGSNYSDKVWNRTESFSRKVEELVTRGFIQGKNPQVLASELQACGFGRNGDGGTLYECERLLRTESAWISEQATLSMYQRLGVQRYDILATLDMRTSDICRALDGETYEVAKAVVGVNYPPFHAHCRTTTVPHMEDTQDLGMRAARNVQTGKTVYVPAGMRFKEWYRKEIGQGLPAGNGVAQTAGNAILGVVHALTPDEEYTVNSYISSGAYGINEKLRSGADLNEEESAFVVALDSALKKFPDYEGIVYRSLSEYGIEDIEAFLAEYPVGAYKQFPSYMSTGTAVYDETMPIQYIIQSKSGKDLRTINPNEAEVLFARDAWFKIVSGRP
ncbi:MAG: minor capsid protein [Oscillospiraceae bacterium]